LSIGGGIQIGSAIKVLHYIPDKKELYQAITKEGSYELSKLGWTFFVSYNHNDIKKVLILRRELFKRGYGAWIAHAENREEREALDFVGRHMQRQNYFLLYLSRNSLLSRWVRTEYDIVTVKYHKPTLLVFDGADHDLLNLLAFFMEHEDQQATLLEASTKVFSSEIPSVGRDWLDAVVQPFLHRIKRLLDQVTATTAYPFPSAIEQRVIVSLKIRTLDVALSALH
jgi:hypothetical protein